MVECLLSRRILQHDDLPVIDCKNGVQLNTDSTAGNDTPPARFNEENRRRQLIEVTLDSLAERGYLGTTLCLWSRILDAPGAFAELLQDARVAESEQSRRSE
jgi:hypothetical protein